jgi:excinuclease ABC subunit B
MNAQIIPNYPLKGDYHQAIEKLTKGIIEEDSFQTLFGVTGCGKTFTVPNDIQKEQRLTLVLNYNKSLIF